MKFLPKGRLDAFADGVFAIVITLLVLDLAVPEISTDLLSGLMDEWPVFLAYIISFAYVGSTWISHSSLTHLMKKETTHSYRLTLLLLFFVSLLPFTTKIMAMYLGNPPIVQVTIQGLDLPALFVTVNTISRSALSTPITIYGLNLLAATLTFMAIIRSAISIPEIHINAEVDGELDALLRREKSAVLIILCTLVLGLFFPLIAVSGFIVVSILFFITPTISTAKATLKK